MAVAKTRAKAQTVAASTPRSVGLAPVVAPDCKLLILGSFPGQASLSAQQYYAHAQNQFWRLLQAIWPHLPIAGGAVAPYPEKCQWLLARGLGLWDVYASCQRQGSLDSAIRAASPNDLAGLVAQLPQLRAIAHNGGESYKHAKISIALGLPVYRLPSSSPANASWRFECKLAAWASVVQQSGLV